MPAGNLNPSAIPWKVLAASPDMMDGVAGFGSFPTMWRSSLAISAFEPPADEETEARLCGQRITFVKITCSLTGYEPRSGETGTILFDNQPLMELDRLTSRYLGCYGALLNVAFYPGDASPGSQIAPDRLPHILDFSPKNRELVRSITEGGEVLTGSARNLSFDESRTTTEKSETSVGVEAGIEQSGIKATGKLEHTWGTSQEDRRGQTAGTSDTEQRAERFSTTMDQLYSVLTGYHTGTNRGTVLMLARPGVLEPTNRRTFVQGLRMLEGVQEFVFVVARPPGVEGLCVEAALDTGHFPDDAEQVPEGEPETRSFTFNVFSQVAGRGGVPLAGSDNRGSEILIPDGPRHIFNLTDRPEGEDWVLDLDRPGGWWERIADRSRLVSPDPRHAVPTDGILTHPPERRQIPLRLEAMGERSAQAVLVGGPMYARGPRWGRNHQIDTIVDQDFRIWVQRRRRPGAGDRPIDTAHLLVTRRNLSACFRLEGGCPVSTGPLRIPSIDESRFREVDTGLPQTPNLPTDVLAAGFRRAMAGAAAEVARGGVAVPLSHTDFFARSVGERLPSFLGSRAVAEILDVQNLDPDLQNAFKQLTVRQFLSLELRDLARGTGLDRDSTVQLRGRLLGHLERRLTGEEQDPPPPPVNGPPGDPPPNDPNPDDPDSNDPNPNDPDPNRPPKGGGGAKGGGGGGKGGGGKGGIAGPLVSRALEELQRRSRP
ncbi:MAG: hypothetical protein EA422_14275 [Gemmatimonadales bacterium]|nr:MAG: hypothetical protein EA422_14275 [Gemmatimonadales bacterium]